MELRNTNHDRGYTDGSILKSVDWLTLFIYLLFVTLGVFSIYAASYQFEDVSIFSMDIVSGKQIMWAGISLCVAFSLLLIDIRAIEAYSYHIYIFMLLVLIMTIFLAHDIKGSRSWISIGSFSMQPAEFAKTATALCLAKLFGTYQFSLNKGGMKNYAICFGIILAPIIIIICQKETGSALIYFSLMFVLYREGMSGLVLLAGLMAIVYFVVTLKFSEILCWGLPMGEFIVFILIMVTFIAMLLIYCKAFEIGRNVLLGFIGFMLLGTILSFCGVNVNGLALFLTMIVISVIYTLALIFKEDVQKVAITVAFAVISVVFMFSVNYAFHNILAGYQQSRIEVALDIKEDLKGDGYNVNQAKIAIGSGGIFGKGYLNGTQTKLKYVPEQHTDFIFCTIGEEYGFVGSTVVLLLFLILILRIIVIAERQNNGFGRVYAYCVVSYLILHLSINIGMVLGLCPVIGIPLPFFSYGGSSLLGFTIMFFILLKIDASRDEMGNY